MAADTLQTLRDPIGQPPRDRNAKRGSERVGSKSKLTSLAGTGYPPSTPDDDDIASPEGEFGDVDYDEGNELDDHPVVQAFEHYGQAKAHLQIVGTLMPQVMLVVQDLVTLLDQLIPQQAAAMLSGSAMDPAMGMAGTGMAPGVGGPQMSGLQQLAGQPPAGPAPAGPMAATPGGMGMAV